MGTALSNTNQGNIEGSMADYQRRTGAGLVKAWLTVSAVVVVDISSSMGTHDAGDGHRRVDVARMELAKLQKKLQGQIAVVEFNYDARWRRDGLIGEPTGGTNLGGALEYVEELLGPGLPRVTVVVVSDGEPNDEQSALEAGKRIAGKGATLSTVYVGPDADYGKAFLRRLAALGGGEHADALLVKALSDTVVKLLTAGHPGTPGQ